ncbi:hypothetical protein NW765_008557 [Fusarium oxysporum]|nr:hypothetical protein NW765_008557 [Fusarium oxysporum]
MPEAGAHGNTLLFHPLSLGMASIRIQTTTFNGQSSPLVTAHALRKYHDPDVCKPSAYSKRAKIICPDAYSFAYDDQKSTFIIPNGGGWEIVMCPKGRSTNILRQLGDEMNELAQSGTLSEVTQKKLRDVSYIVAERSLGNHVLPIEAMMASTALATAIWLLV